MLNYKGEERRVGFEIEFQNLSPEKVADILSGLTDGEIEKKSDASFLIKTSYGNFIAETDSRFIKNLAEISDNNIRGNKFDFEGVVRDIIEPVTNELIPSEIVSPPLVESQFDIIKKIENEIIKKGAKGTNESVYFAFALQLNPDILSTDSLYLVNILRSYILLTNWLKSQIFIDFARKTTSFADDFPTGYATKILSEDYHPNLDQLIDDYLEYNPTRNRGLDMLPLFLFLDEKRVRAVVKDEKVKARPTFHYRLPSCQIGLASWNILIEWKRWLILEKLSQNQDFLKKMSRAYLKLFSNTNITFASKWLSECNHYIEDLR